MKSFAGVLFFIMSSLSYSQDFTFNEDGTSADITYRVDKPANEIYAAAVVWIGKYYMGPEYVLKESVVNKMMKLEGHYWNVLNTYPDNYNTKYDAEYTIIINFRDNEYTVEYIHKSFTAKEQVVRVKLHEVLNQAITNKKRSNRENYEFKINNTYSSLNHYIQTGELIISPIKLPDIAIPNDFAFTDGDSLGTVEYKINKTAEQLYRSSLKWINRTYKHPKMVIKDSIPNKKLLIEASMWRIFNRDISIENKLSKYSSTYCIEMLFHNGGYTITYKHTGFT